MSTVTAVYGIERNIRTADDIIRAKTGDKTRSVVVLDKKKGINSQNKVVRATLKGKEYLPGFTIILDLFHVMERLWSLSYFFHEEGSDDALKWVRKYLKMFLTGKVGHAIGGIRQSAKKKGLKPNRIEAMEKHLRYFETKKHYMKYDEYWESHIAEQKESIYKWDLAS